MIFDSFIAIISLLAITILALFFSLSIFNEYVDYSNNVLNESELNYSKCHQGNYSYTFYNFSTKSTYTEDSGIKIYSQECIDSLK